MAASMKRRTLILSGLGGAAMLVVGWGVLPARSRLGSARRGVPSRAGARRPGSR